MNPFESLIDACEFGTVVDYLRNPNSPIEYIVYVRDAVQLAPFAQELARYSDQFDLIPWAFPAAIRPALESGQARISTRNPSVFVNPRYVVAPTSICRHTPCHVIYSPPAYLVHLQDVRVARPG